MIAGLFRRNGARRRAVEGLHRALSEAARRPGLYTRLGVPDTVEGRFEALCLHVILALRRLDRLPAPAADVAQDLVDSVFAQLDASLRELGVGDLGVGKRMKKLAAGFYGRAAGYSAALDGAGGAGGHVAGADVAGGDVIGGDGPLRSALARNVLGGETLGGREGDGGEGAAGLAAYVRAADAALAEVDLDAMLAGPPFPDPEAFAATPAAAAAGGIA